MVNIYFFRWLNGYSFFNRDREGDQSLVVGAGIPEQWLTEPGGISLRDLHTYGGKLDIECGLPAAGFTSTGRSQAPVARQLSTASLPILSTALE